MPRKMWIIVKFSVTFESELGRKRERQLYCGQSKLSERQSGMEN